MHPAVFSGWFAASRPNGTRFSLQVTEEGGCTFNHIPFFYRLWVQCVAGLGHAQKQVLLSPRHGISSLVRNVVRSVLCPLAVGV